MSRRLAALVALLVLAAALTLCWRIETIAGTVRDGTGSPVAGASVRLKATPFATVTGADGRFELSGLPHRFRPRVTAAKQGSYVTGVRVWPWRPRADLTLVALAANDNADYVWALPEIDDRSAIDEVIIRTALATADALSVEHAFKPLSERLPLACRDCHDRPIYREWASSAHALGTANPRFMTMYNGTDVHGRTSPPARRGTSPDYGSFTLPPASDRPYYGPGYKIDFPRTAGNCSACHLPGAAVASPYGVDPNDVTGVDARGTHCDFCHKVSGVRLDVKTQRPRPNMPGVLSLQVTRPDDDRQLFFGPYDDVDAGNDSYLPLMGQSEICAPCHDASFWETPIYTSFAEWKSSSFASDGVTCQSCHMRPTGRTSNFAKRRGGTRRDAHGIASHGFPGAGDAQLLRSALSSEFSARRSGDRLLVDVTLSNVGAGHHVPTGSPLRQVILLVRATDSRGQPLSQLGGPTVPSWAGTGSRKGHYAGVPGQGFAKILEDTWTRARPTAAYWNRTRIVSDNRIAAGASHASTFVFAAPDAKEAQVEVAVLYRRAFVNLMEQKGWDVPDIVMAEERLTVALERGTEETEA